MNVRGGVGRRFLLVVVAAAVALFVVFWLVQRRMQSTAALPPKERSRSLYRGTPEELAEIAREIEAIRGESIDQVVARLSERNTYDFPMLFSGDANPQQHIDRVLANRRTLRLLGELRALPAEQAQRRAREIYGQVTAEFEATMRYVVRRAGDKSLPKAKHSMLGVQGGQCVGLFLLAHCGDSSKVLQELVRIKRFSEESCGAMTGHLAKNAPDGKPVAFVSKLPDGMPGPAAYLATFKRYSEPDNAFQLNVLVYAVERDGKISAEDKETLRRELASLPSEEVVLTAWDAQITSYDRPHVVNGVPVDASEDATTIKVYRWPRSSDQTTEAEERKAIERVMAFVQRHYPQTARSRQ